MKQKKNRAIDLSAFHPVIPVWRDAKGHFMSARQAAKKKSILWEYRPITVRHSWGHGQTDQILKLHDPQEYFGSSATKYLIKPFAITKWTTYDYRKRKKVVLVSEVAKRMFSKFKGKRGLVKFEVSASIAWRTKDGKTKRRSINYVQACNSYSTNEQLQQCLHQAFYNGMSLKGKPFPQQTWARNEYKHKGRTTIVYELTGTFYTITKFSWREISVFKRV